MNPPTSIEWQTRTVPASLEDREIHVWYLPLKLSEPDQIRFGAMLDEDESQRAGRLAFPHLRERYIAAHGVMRWLLGRYLGRDPQSLRFTKGPHGKPYLKDVSLQFNLSHSDQHALLAVTRLAEVGIDIEGLERKVEVDGIAKRFFSEAEAQELFELSGSDRRMGFLNLWTRKEAWLKATGIGISEGLNQVEFNCRPGETARLLRIKGDSSEAASWTILSFDTPAESFKGALAVRDNPGRVTFHRVAG